MVLDGESWKNLLNASAGKYRGWVLSRTLKAFPHIKSPVLLMQEIHCAEDAPTYTHFPLNIHFGSMLCLSPMKQYSVI